MKDLNQNWKERDTIIFGNSLEEKYDIKSFSKLSVEKAKELLDKNFADPDDAQNDAPTFQEMIDFCTKYPQVKMHGYAVNISRSDYRVTIEGLEYNGIVSKELMIEFTNLFRDADDFNVQENELFCWFD